MELKNFIWFGTVLLLGLGMMMPSPAEAQVVPGLGRVSLNGEVQLLFDRTQPDEDNGQVQVEEFRPRSRLALRGELGQRAGFYLRGELPGDTAGRPVLLDARADLNPIPAITLSAGSFQPPWTFYLPADLHDLDTLRPPLIVDPQFTIFNPGRQTGAMLTFHFGDNVLLNAGTFNGRDRPDNLNDNNTTKDALLSLEVALREDFRLKGGYYTGEFHVNSVSLEPGESITLPTGDTVSNDTNQPLTVAGYDLQHESFNFGLSGNLGRDRVRIRAEYLHHTADNQGSTQLTSLGYLVHLGLVPIRRLEVLGRYEYLEPNTGVDKNELIWVTTGLNLELSRNTRLSLNYIFKTETGDSVSQGGNRSRNDEFLAGITAWW